MIKLKKLQLFLFQLLLLLSGSSILMVLLKGFFSPLFGLYKEFFCISIIFLRTDKLKLSSKQILFSFSFMLFTLLSILSTQQHQPIAAFFYIYQFKIEFFYILLILALISLTKTESATLTTYRAFKKVIFLLVIINIFSSITQHLFFDDLLHFLGYKGDVSGLRGDFGGVVIQTQNGLFRSIGLFSTPMALAEFLAFALIFCSYNIKKPLLKAIFITTCLLGIFFTSYKTTWTYLPALLFFIFTPTRLHRSFTSIYCIVLISFGFLATHTYYLYDLFLNVSPNYAEFSIRLRIEYIDKVIQQMEHFTQYLFGSGYGFNGGLIEYLPGAVPLDSLYIYTLSNYGFAMVTVLLFYLLFTVCRISYLKYNVSTDKGVNLFVIKNYLLVVLSANLFWNNPIVNYPSLLFPIVCYFLLVKLRIYERNSLDNAT